jgi:hypothetical protein
LALTFALIVPLASAATAGETAPDDKVAELVGQGNALLGEGNYNVALRTFEKANRAAEGTSAGISAGGI